MSEICSGVTTEPYLQILTSESLGGATAIRGDEARLDIVADGLWGGRRERTYFDVRVVNAYARSNRLESLPALYCRHEKMKRRAYDQRVRTHDICSPRPLPDRRCRNQCCCLSDKTCLRVIREMGPTLQPDHRVAQGKAILCPAKELHILHKRGPNNSQLNPQPRKPAAS